MHQQRPRRAGFSRGQLLTILVTAAGIVAVGIALLRPWQPSGIAYPNILVISLCSVRPDHMGFHGYERDTTPGFDALALESVVFDHAVTPWPKTAPAFAAIMSGKYGHTTGVMRITPRQHLGAEHETLAEVLGAQGYDTAVFTSSPALNRQTNILQGFETIVETFRASSRDASFNDVTREAVSWLGRERQKPFLLWAHYNNAHYPYDGDPVAPGLFVDDGYYDFSRDVDLNSAMPLSLPVSEDHPYRRQILRPDIGGVHSGAVLGERPTEYAFYVARYDAGIHAADRMAEELLGAARNMGAFENTIVVVVGDHGEALGEHGYYFEHGRFPYDDCARVPLMIRPPGGTEPQRVAVPVPVLGLAPTLLDMCGIEAPIAMEARSFWPVVSGGVGPDYVFTESGYQLDYTLSVRDTTWKLIHVPNAVDRSLMTGHEFELYELTVDPGEMENSYGNVPDEAARLRSALDAWSRHWVERAYSLPAPRPDAQVDDQTLRRLRSLGYIADDE